MPLDKKSMRNIAQYAGVSTQTVHRYFHDPHSLTLGTYLKVAAAMDKTISLVETDLYDPSALYYANNTTPLVDSSTKLNWRKIWDNGWSEKRKDITTVCNPARCTQSISYTGKICWGELASYAYHVNSDTWAIMVDPNTPFYALTTQPKILYTTHIHEVAHLMDGRHHRATSALGTTAWIVPMPKEWEQYIVNIDGFNIFNFPETEDILQSVDCLS